MLFNAKFDRVTLELPSLLCIFENPSVSSNAQSIARFFLRIAKGLENVSFCILCENISRILAGRN